MAAPAIQDGSGAGVGYTFADTVTAEQRSGICQLLASWGGRSDDERERMRSSSSAKAPGGEVVFFSGVVPYVHNSKTKHLWVPANTPPPPAAAPRTQGTRSSGVGRHEPGTNPWRGKAVNAGTFQQTSGDRKDLSGPTNEGAGGTCGGSAIGEAATHVSDDSAPRNRKGASSAPEEKEGELTERESRIASEPGVPTETRAFRKHTVGGKGRSRRRGSTGRRGRGQSDASTGQGDELAERPRVKSEAMESTTSDATGRSTTTPPQENAIASDSPRNQHRKLRPRAMEAQNNQATGEEPAAGADAADGAPAAILTPSAPSKIKPSKSTKTYW